MKKDTIKYIKDCAMEKNLKKLSCNDIRLLLIERDELLASLQEIANRGVVPGYTTSSALMLRLVGSQSVARAAIEEASK
jgi:hypothetical protein